MIDARRANDGPLRRRKQQLPPYAGLALARGRVERGLGDEGLLIVSGAHVMRIRAGENQRAPADGMTPAKGRAQLIGGIEGEARRRLRWLGPAPTLEKVCR